MNSSNTVSVCSDACKLRVDLSDSNTAVCEVPPLATTFSVENYAISKDWIRQWCFISMIYFKKMKTRICIFKISKDNEIISNLY